MLVADFVGLSQLANHRWSIGGSQCFDAVCVSVCSACVLAASRYAPEFGFAVQMALIKAMLQVVTAATTHLYLYRPTLANSASESCDTTKTFDTAVG